MKQLTCEFLNKFFFDFLSFKTPVLLFLTVFCTQRKIGLSKALSRCIEAGQTKIAFFVI